MKEIWEKAQAMIKERVGEHFHEMWFRPVELAQVKDGSAVLEIPNRFFKEWVEDNYPGLLTDVLKEATGEALRIKYRMSEKPDSESKKIDSQLETRKTRLASRGIFLNPKYIFGNFVEGESNRFAKAAAEAVAGNPGRSYNPLFVYGGVGLGKTHLISAIGNAVADRIKNFHLLYVSSEQFTNEVVHAVRHGKTDELKAKYRNLDMLLIDDIQFVENKAATQEELFHTLNSLYEGQKQIVISSDRPPKEIKNLTDRLRSRFSMGLIADIQPPEYETKVAIIHKKAEMERISLPAEVVEFLARRIKSNIRELEGCLIRLAAHSSLTGTPIDLAMAKNVLRDVTIEEDNKPLTVDVIIKAVAEHFGIKVADMKARKRTRDIAMPRQVAMYLARELTEASLSEIGKAVGGKDHATVIYACRQMADKRANDENFSGMLESLINRLKP
ncbi:MAG: chromosomal replication initiator protein DnaA [Nitrospiraceae bacterium]|nr:chromosomal replication initiator protein DnaA [Nitrospiraceae bacterium]